jgi:phosphoribosylaminoimidazolecarboxamide formyltransferase/IMP cyclohydrolase
LYLISFFFYSATVVSGSSFETCIENIDIGGPSMLRSSSKNHAYVTVATSPSQYADIMAEMTATGGFTLLATRRRLAAAAFALSASYDASISRYFSAQLDLVAPVETRSYRPQISLKYGCNPHQKPAGIYSLFGDKMPFKVVNGIPGYINLLDACNAWQLVIELKRSLGLPAAASFKHCSPAGAALAVPLTQEECAAYEILNPALLSPIALAYVRARNADPMCSFGDFVALSDVIIKEYHF